MINSFLNDKSKNLSLLNRNYFFAATLSVALLNIFLYMFATSGNAETAPPDWNTFSVKNLATAFANAYMHNGLQHCMLNMLCFLVAGIYLERKKGSLAFFSFVFVMSAFTAFATCANSVSLNWRGFSVVNYGLYGYIVVEYVSVLLTEKKRYLFNIISGGVMLALIYFAMCFCGGTSTVAFKPYPYDLLHNIGHASGFAAGLIFGAYETIFEAINAARRKTRDKK